MPFNIAVGGGGVEMTTEEETKDSGNDLQGSSSYDQLSSALSATSTSMISLEDDDFVVEEKKLNDISIAVASAAKTKKAPHHKSNMLAGMQPSPRHQNPVKTNLITDKSLVIIAKPTATSASASSAAAANTTDSQTAIDDIQRSILKDQQQ